MNQRANKLHVEANPIKFCNLQIGQNKEMHLTEINFADGAS